MKDLNYDVLIIGAGISGIGNAYWLQKKCPDQRFAILEAREKIGGTWSLFKYPGVRSDSDMFTFGYRFKPWTQPKALSDANSILTYLKETIDENDLDPKIKFQHKMIHANWSSTNHRWTIEVESPQGKLQMTCRFLSICTGYYNYKEAHRPQFKNENLYKGKIVQPQFWPDKLDYLGKKVAVIGSGATAVTLVPAMAESGAEKVSMIQRSPTYVVSLPNKTGAYQWMQKVMPLTWAFRIARIQNILFQIISFQLSRIAPGFMKSFFMKKAAKDLPENYPVEKHFNPSYDPWDQRLCVIPDGDLFKSIKNGKAEIITGTIESFTETGVQMKDGAFCEADIIVLATGLNIQLLGGADLKIDGVHPDISKSLVYKGMMLSGIPNLIYCFGYTNASWTLKVDLSANFLCKLIKYMDKTGLKAVEAVVPERIETEAFLNLSSGYIKRAKTILPSNGKNKPWRVYQNYIMDMLNIRYAKINHKALEFEK